ncbi:MAG: SIS domain-containing protein [Alphaproteobacteria bacterium]|nr:SIS domain-containing protein [Alphaproteobacteria bacterium]
MVDLETKQAEFHPDKAGNFDPKAYWEEYTSAHMRVAKETFETQMDTIIKMVDMAEEVIKRGNKVLFFGNGGSAADSQHIAAEMAVKLYQERSPIAALALSLDSSALTATGNDYGFDQIYQRQIRALGYAGDLAVGLSTSGNSPNILNGLKKARRMDMQTVGWSGATGGKMPPLCDLMLLIPETYPGRIQEMHITLGHMFVGMLEQRLGLV